MVGLLLVSAIVAVIALIVWLLKFFYRGEVIHHGPHGTTIRWFSHTQTLENTSIGAKGTPIFRLPVRNSIVPYIEDPQPEEVTVEEETQSEYPLLSAADEGNQVSGPSLQGSDMLERALLSYRRGKKGRESLAREMGISPYTAQRLLDQLKGAGKL